MFQKPPFGSTNTSTFGSFNAGASTASPFGGFKPTTGTSAFGAPPTFGAGTATQPTTGGGLFGTTNTTGGLFGGSTASTSTPAFGANTSGFGFGASTSTGGLFGSNTGTGLFGNTQNTSAFGAKPAGFGFGATSTATPSTGGLFGSTPAATTGLFGQQNNTMSGGGLFSNNTGAFGQQQTASGTAHVKYSPVVGTDVVVKGGTSQNINIKHHCITCMKEYENKSLEELRLEDYQAGRKGAQAGGMFGGFSAPQQENKPLFGGSTFGQPAATTASSVFGGGGLSTNTGFGQTNTFSFGSNAQNPTNTTSLFNKPAFGATPSTGTPLFGATTTQAPTFGTSTSTFGFGANTQNQTGGLFGAKPATSTAFGSLPTTGFGGGFGSTNMFQSKPQQAPPAFGAQQPAFGSVGAFGTTTSSAPLFGGAFGKPATAAPAFGTALPQPQAAGAGLGTGLGANSFQVKPGGFGGGSLFQPQQTNTFRTDSGLGSGMFGNTSTLGAPSLGMGLNANNSMLNNTSISGASSGNVHEQMLTLAARPYGDSPLFKDLLPDSSANAEEALKPTNPAAMKAVLDSSGPQYRLDQRPPALKLHPRTAHDKKSLFDGLEESDASLEDKLSLKPSRKRLVLRPNNQRNEPVYEEQSQNNRSLESEPTEANINGALGDNRDQPDSATEQERPKRSVNFDDQNADSNADKNGSWLSASKIQWNEKEKAVDSESTPRLYPNIDKELSTQVSERRASWLTTKPLRKPLISNPDSAENSVRELGVRTPEKLSSDKENIDSLSESVSSDQLQFCMHRGGERCTSCEKIAHQISGIYVSEEENVAPREMPPHPTGVKLTRPGYYTIPSLDEMIHYMRPDGSCVVPHLTIGRHNYGNVFYDCEIDVAGLDLDSLVHFLNKEIIVYPEDSDKPPVGSGLNRRAVVTLDRVWPRDKSQRRPITDPDRLLKMDYENKLRRVCYKHDTKFIEYRPQTGSWVFRVEHFSKYGLTDSDEEDDGPTPEVLKRQIANQALQKAAPLPGVKPPPVQSPGLGGLGGLGSLGGLGGPPAAPAEDTLLAMHQTSLNLLNGAGKAFEMDTTEDNAESQSLYHPDNRAFGVKSPTSELARLENRRSHHVQLMKASLYADTEMEDDVSVSTGDQLVPISAPTAVPGRPASVRLSEHLDTMDITPPALEVSELPMRPLIVRPHTIVLKYHRKVPPFKDTIAGRLNAAYIADMAVCRARHSRAGFGPRANIAYVTSLDSISHLPKDAELCDLGRYVRGRAVDDWSESVVARLAIAQGDSTNYIQESLSRHLETLLKYSDLTDVPEGQCPRLRVRDAPRDRRQLLLEHIRDAKDLATGGGQKFGVTSSYCLQVWKLCEALWGADLENDGVPGTDVASIVNRHRKFLEWMQEVVSEETDDELSKPTKGEDEDEEDGHSARVWTLLVGGRILEACRVSREHGDLNMAALIAQASGDPNFRSLLSRQLSQWTECGADTLISSHKMACFRLLAGHSTSLLNLLSWSRALLAVYKYLCPQIPSLERAIRTYEGFFTKSDDEVDLSTLEPDQTGMQLPLPPYMAEYEMFQNGHQRRVLDLRYCLVRARATNSRPKLRPEAYTPQPFDYSLCFLLGSWFGEPSVDSITGVADQLEACGLWHLAVQALAYHPDDVCRGHLIRGVLSRHAPAQADTPDLKSRLELIRKLGVPEKWLLLAQAHRAKYERLPLVEAMLLSGAGQWNAAHRVLVDELLPEAVLSDNLESVAPLLQQLNEAASRHEISGWESGGQALYHYANICTEIRGLVSSAEAGTGVSGDRTRVSTRLEALRPSVAAACKALAQLHPKTARMAAARAEMGGRAVQLALASGASPACAAQLLRTLRLPPASVAPHYTQITQELAEQASDSCIESASSSPLSSHHRTKVQS